MSIPWLKFNLRDNLKNFNIIPSGNINLIPDFYKSIITSINFVKKNDKEKILDIKSDRYLKLKIIYDVIKKFYFIKPKIEQQFINFSGEWESIYSSIHKKYFKSSIRSFNYRFIFDALPTTDKFNTDNLCFFCNKYIEPH